ncbi:hypothetical protein B0H13DRAFT_2021555 [Mycena leptocephala]|nr:hypothetical protein B0H13DRAFT_2021555 [Mycena leptocephala]
MRGCTDEISPLYNDITSVFRATNILPAFYAGLFVDPISKLLELLDGDHFSSSDLQVFDDTIHHALMCLQGLLIIRSKVPAFSTNAASSRLWARAWPWMEFIHTYRNHLPAVPVLQNLRSVYSIFVCTTDLLKGDAVTSRQIDATPGVRSIVVRAWALSLAAEDPGNDIAFRSLCQQIARSALFLDATTFEAGIEGAGGSLNDLAELLVRHLRFVVDDSGTPEATIIHLAPVFRVLCAPPVLDDPVFADVLTDHGIIPLLAQVAIRVSLPAFHSEEDLLSGCLVRLLKYTAKPSGHDLLAHSLGAGLLQAIVARCRRSMSQKLKDIVTVFLMFLTSAMVFLSVLQQVDVAMEDLSITSLDSLKGLVLFDRWSSFWRILERGRSVMVKYRELKDGASRACDNMECGAIIPKTRLRRCSGCLTSLYCSPQCQLWDWRRDGHRRVCDTLYGCHSGHIRQTDKAFLRALIHHDYMERRDSIWLWQMRYIRRESHTMPLVMFDYTVPFLPVQVALGQPDGGDTAWADCSARAARSRGRMQMHLVKVKDGSSTRHLVFPLRSTTGEVVAALRRLAADPEGDGGETDEARVRSLLDIAVTEIH